MDTNQNPKDIIIENLLTSIEQLTCLINLINTKQNSLIIPDIDDESVDFDIERSFVLNMEYYSKVVKEDSEEFLKEYKKHNKA
jgi:hypothetical protein